MWDSGSIVGRLILDKSQFTNPLRQSVAEAQGASKQLQTAIEKPFAPATVEVKKLTGGVQDLVSSMSQVQPAAQAFSMLPGPIGQTVRQVWSLVQMVGLLTTSYGVFTGAAVLTASAHVTVARASAAAAVGEAAAAAAANAGAAANTRLAVSIVNVAAARRAARGGGARGGDEVVDAEFTVRGAQRMIGAVNAIVPAAESASGSMLALSTTGSSAGGSIALTGESVNAATPGMVNLTAVAGGLTESLGAAGAAAIAIGPPLIGLGIISAALDSRFVKAAGSAEMTAAGFTTLLRSADAAQAVLKELHEFAATTPFQFPEVAQTARTLLNAGIAASQMKQELKVLGDVATGSQTSLTDLARIYTQVANKGKADAMDLMQLANHGLPIYAALAASLNVSKAELRSMVEAGEIGFPQIQAAFAAMTGKGGQFHDSMKNSAGLIEQLKSNMEDAWTAMDVSLGKALLKGLDLREWVKEFTNDIEAATPTLVNLFSAGTVAAQPFLDSLRSGIGLIGELNAEAKQLGSSTDATFGEGSTKKVGKFVLQFEPLTRIVMGVGQLMEVVRWTLNAWGKVRDEAYNLGRDVRAAVNPTQFAAEESDSYLRRRADALKEAGKSAEAYKAIAKATLDQELLAAKSESERFTARARYMSQIAAINAAERANQKATPAKADEGKPPESQSKPDKGAIEKAARDAEASSDRANGMFLQARADQLKAAGKEAEASLLELQTKWDAIVGNAKGDVERAQASASYGLERSLLIAKQKSEADKADAEAIQKAMDASIEVSIAQLRANGQEIEADLLELWKKADRDFKAAKGNSGLQRAVTDKYDLDAAAIRQKAEADAAKKLKEQQQESADARTELVAAQLEEQGRAFDAELLRFDAMWKKKIDAAERSEDKITLAATYASERRRKVAEQEVQAIEAEQRRLSETVKGFDSLSGSQRDSAYAALARFNSMIPGQPIAAAADPFVPPPAQAPSPTNPNGTPPAGSENEQGAVAKAVGNLSEFIRTTLLLEVRKLVTEAQKPRSIVRPL